MLSWAAAIFELIAVWLIGHKKAYGFFIFAIGSIFWICTDIANPGARGLVFVSSILFVMNIRYYFRWKADDAKEEEKKVNYPR